MSCFGPDVAAEEAAFIHPTAQLYGRVTVAEGVSLWPNTVVRAEWAEVRIGRFSNIQDFVMIHVGNRPLDATDPAAFAEIGLPTVIGDYCSITHQCTLHGCTIGDHCLIGINSTIMDGCRIGDNCIIGGHTFLKPGTVIPDNSIVMGSPGRVARTVNSFVANRLNAMLYYRNALACAEDHHRAWSGPDFVAFLQEELQRAKAEFAARYGGVGNAAEPHPEQ